MMTDEDGRNEGRRRHSAPRDWLGSIRMGSYQEIMRPTFERLAADPNAAVREFAARLERCLRCPGDRKCDGCPYLGSS